MDLECELYALQNANATLNRKINEKNNEISRLKIKNDELNRKLEELDFNLRNQAKKTISVSYHGCHITVILKWMKLFEISCDIFCSIKH